MEWSGVSKGLECFCPSKISHGMPCHAMPLINLARLINPLSSSFTCLVQMGQHVYQYWNSKRTKMKKSLLRDYWPVTASNDTNPHNVFRPRDKEKYKLRKHRKNDIEAYRKVQQLSRDFERISSMVSLVHRREKILHAQNRLRKEIFEQKMFDCLDTSGEERKGKLDLMKIVHETQIVPKQVVMSSSSSTQRHKRRKLDDSGDLGRSRYGASNPTTSGTPLMLTDTPQIPLFTDYLPERESYQFSWDDDDDSDGLEPCMSERYHYIVDNMIDPFGENNDIVERFRYKHRGRIGRGGRLCIDRIPYRVYEKVVKDESGNPITDSDGEVVTTELSTVIRRTGDYQDVRLSGGLLDVCPPPVHSNIMHARILEISNVWSDDEDAEVVDNSTWDSERMEKWGVEKFAFGPF